MRETLSLLKETLKWTLNKQGNKMLFVKHLKSLEYLSLKLLVLTGVKTWLSMLKLDLLWHFICTFLVFLFLFFCVYFLISSFCMWLKGSSYFRGTPSPMLSSYQFKNIQDTFILTGIGFHFRTFFARDCLHGRISLYTSGCWQHMTWLL